MLQSVANLAAIGLERAREREAATATEAARRSGELRAALLDAVAHEFKTPLTSIRAAAGGLTGLVTTDDARELLAIVDEESARLQGLVSDAIQMFHVEAGDFEVRPERHDLRGLVDRVDPRARHAARGADGDESDCGRADRSKPMPTCSGWRCASSSTTR